MTAQQKVKSFEKRMGWNTTHAGQIALFLKKDAMLLSGLNAKHKLVDLYLEVLQLANRNNVDLDRALARHLKEAEKKYKKVK
jgi:hypothetical protein